MNNNKWILFHLLYKDLLGGFVVKKVAIQINPEEIEYEYFHEEDVQNKIRELIMEHKNFGVSPDFLDIVDYEEIDVLN